MENSCDMLQSQNGTCFPLVTSCTVARVMWTVCSDRCAECHDEIYVQYGGVEVCVPPVTCNSNDGMVFGRRE
ncbi:hypothetical protein ACROYT_G013476 [Oculina patagonica]